MAKNNESYDEIIRKIQLDPSRRNLKPTSKIPNIAELVIEGNRLLELEEKQKSKKDPTPAPKSNLAVNSNNPYIRARIELLSNMSKEESVVIQKMEQGLLPKDSRFDKFSIDLMKLGDKLSSES